MSLTKRIMLILSSAAVFGCGTSLEYLKPDLGFRNEGRDVLAYDRNKDGKWDGMISEKKEFNAKARFIAEDADFNSTWEALSFYSKIGLYEAAYFIEDNNDNGVYEKCTYTLRSRFEGRTYQKTYYFYDTNEDGKFDKAKPPVTDYFLHLINLDVDMIKDIIKQDLKELEKHKPE